MSRSVLAGLLALAVMQLDVEQHTAAERLLCSIGHCKWCVHLIADFLTRALVIESG